LRVYIPKFGRNDLDKQTLDSTFLFYYYLYPSDSTWKMGMQEPNQQNVNVGEALHQLIRWAKG
jgi:hypothetical protein